MKNYISILKKVNLFSGIDEDDLPKLIECLNAVEKYYDKNNVITLIGDEINSIGIVLNGNVHIIKEDFYGNKNIIAQLECADIFAETFACANIKTSPVTVLSVTPCKILFLDFNRIHTTCVNTCNFHTTLIYNMLAILANKNLMLNQKIEIISKRSIRQKILTYCATFKNNSNNKTFTIPYNRNELADYLCVDRSALSRELGNLRDEGILTADNNIFTFLQ